MSRKKRRNAIEGRRTGEELSHMRETIETSAPPVLQGHDAREVLTAANLPGPDETPARFTIAPGPYRLYPEERHWWSMNDYGAVLDVVRKLGAKRILEFGPGSSTLALIEGGATTIDTCEDDPDWAQVYEERLQAVYPDIVRVHRYAWLTPLRVPSVDNASYDLALIDGPLGTNRRPEVIRYALTRCRSVLAPTETKNRALLEAIREIAAETPDVTLETWETGPLSGGFALLTNQ